MHTGTQMACFNRPSLAQAYSSIDQFEQGFTMARSFVRLCYVHPNVYWPGDGIVFRLNR